MYPRAEGKGDREKLRWTYHFLPSEASSDGPVITHTQQQFWKPGDLEQEHVLQRGEGGREKGRGRRGGGDGMERQVQKVGGRKWERGRQRWTGRGRCRKGVGGGQGERWWEGKMRQQQMHYKAPFSLQGSNETTVNLTLIYTGLIFSRFFICAFLNLQLLGIALYAANDA